MIVALSSAPVALAELDGWRSALGVDPEAVGREGDLGELDEAGGEDDVVRVPLLSSATVGAEMKHSSREADDRKLARHLVFWNPSQTDAIARVQPSLLTG